MDLQKSAKELKEELFFTPKTAFDKMSEAEIASAYSFCEGYADFLNSAKTEREAVKTALELAKSNGFEEFKWGTFYPAGSKIYYNNRGKALILAVIGENGVENGVNIAAAHIDSPRLDLKPNPVYESNEMAFFKTHYYGGIKKYQWTTVPLALHGVIVKNNGEKVEVKIGEDENDTQFVITDLLPHLAGEQMQKKMSEGIKGESLNILIGSRPFDDSGESENIKLNILGILNEKYGITEKDFQTAELEAVPAYKARDIGFDRSLIGSYGHDDRVCAYPAFMALLDCDEPEKTAVCVLTDKEEIGSDGNTGLESRYLEYFIRDLAKSEGANPERTFSLSKCLSADVNAAFDPNYPDVFEKNNTSFINRGVVITKYTGARGKSSTSDASAEFMAEILQLLEKNNVCCQTGELGKVDVGGGGTVAKYIARLNIDVVDVGVPVLSMHAPFEVVAKTDVYSAYRAFMEFLKNV